MYVAGPDFPVYKKLVLCFQFLPSISNLLLFGLLSHGKDVLDPPEKELLKYCVKW
jgi:hypothetical protein